MWDHYVVFYKIDAYFIGKYAVYFLDGMCLYL